MGTPAKTSRRALVVEDESSIREIVRLHLSLAGFETHEVADGRVAPNRLRASSRWTSCSPAWTGSRCAARCAPKQEFDILYVLASRRGIVSSRFALIAKVWGGETCVTERTVDSVVSRLRRRTERDPNVPEMILTTWGVGYTFANI